MKRFLLGWLLAFLVSAGPAAAQTYPDYESITVNDFAGLLPPEAEPEISAELDQLREDTGIEMTVVTLSRKDMFAPDQDLETFAAGLFDQWGVGGEGRDDGILFLVLRADRETKIELGKAYEGEWQFEASALINRDVLPAFKQENYEAGIRAGVKSTIETIAIPRHAGAAPPKPATSGGLGSNEGDGGERGGGVSGWWAALIFLPVGLLVLWSKLKAKVTKCPQCGNRGVKITTNRLEEPTEETEGRGETVTECESCGHREVKPFTIAKLAKPDDGIEKPAEKFGGGKSGGGGASGKW